MAEKNLDVFDRVWYGGDYNPEQWDETTFETDLQLMKQAGINLVSLGIFSWALLEPEEGRYELDWLEKIMDRLYENGIYVDLATGTASPPVWMAINYPETLPVTETGVRLGFGSRQQYSPSSKKFRDASAKLARRLAERFKSHPALKMWHIGNEYACHTWESFDEESVQAFREWLRAKYGTIEALNEAWTTNFWSQRYYSFDQVAAPAAAPTFKNPAQLLDWRRFSDNALLECYLNEKRALEEITPDVPITTNFMGLYDKTNYWEWAKHVDFISDDSYPDPADPTSAAQVAFTGDLMRSLARAGVKDRLAANRKPYILMEQVSDMVQWRDTNSPKRPGQHTAWSLARIGHGADAILEFQVRQGPGGAETFHGGLIPHTLDSPTWAENKELGAKLAQLSDIVGKPQENVRVALLLDWENIWASQVSIGPTDFCHAQAVKDWHQTLWEMGNTVEFVSQEDTFEAYDLVVIPRLMAVSDTLLDNLRAAVKTGTNVLITTPFDLSDMRLRSTLGGYGSRAKDLLGVRAVKHYCLTPEPLNFWTDRGKWASQRITGQISTPSCANHVEIELNHENADDTILGNGKSWAELVKVDSSDVRVRGVFASRGASTDIAHCPALTVYSPFADETDRGGEVAYLATDPDPDLSLSVLVSLWGEKFLPALGRPGDFPSGVARTQRQGYLFLTNYGDRPVMVQDVTGTDLFTGETYQGSAELPALTCVIVKQ